MSSIAQSPAGSSKLRQIGAFLLCGGSAALINWGARIGLSEFMPFAPAIIGANVIGMACGFGLYKSFVWPHSDASLKKQVTGFVLVNAVTALVVLAVALALAQLLNLVSANVEVNEALAHGFAIGVGALANYLGHNKITFA